MVLGLYSFPSPVIYPTLHSNGEVLLPFALFLEGAPHFTGNKTGLASLNKREGCFPTTAWLIFYNDHCPQ